MQVMVELFFDAAFAGDAVGWALSCENLTLIVGVEKVKLSACSFMNPSFSDTKTDATCVVLFEDRTSTLASIGALENP